MPTIFDTVFPTRFVNTDDQSCIDASDWRTLTPAGQQVTAVQVPVGSPSGHLVDRHCTYIPFAETDWIIRSAQIDESGQETSVEFSVMTDQAVRTQFVIGSG